MQLPIHALEDLLQHCPQESAFRGKCRTANCPNANVAAKLNIVDESNWILVVLRMDAQEPQSVDHCLLEQKSAAMAHHYELLTTWLPGMELQGHLPCLE